MKKYSIYILFAVLLGGMAALSGCDEKDFSADYDIPWVVSKITNVTPADSEGYPTAAPGANITLTGENLGSDYVQSDGFLIGSVPCSIVSQSATTAVITVPAGIKEPSDITVRNLHNRTFVYGKQLIPNL
ncbi:MAG: IPT/TIG domain-containing protein [Candidatus Symbiothrix sp.]|jgi:hypothetical protein|nr:IPT/TIG domain-containing protein [Candidatus Symbiothrix sp.]